jgi:hypothetical protein
VRDGSDVRVVDLAEGGTILATIPNAPDGVALDPDGELLATYTSDRFDVLRISDGKVVSQAATFGQEPHVAWQRGFVTFTAWRGLGVVYADTLEARAFVPSAPVGENESASFALSSDGAVVAVGYAPQLTPTGHVEVFRRSGDRVATVPSAFVSSLTVEPAGSLVAWVELGDHQRVHSLDVASGRDAFFLAKGPGCEVAPDTITKVEAGRIVTDASCSVGCPSVRWTERVIAYDARTGAVVSDTSTEETKSANEQLADLRERIEKTANRLGVAVGMMAPVPKREAVAVLGESGVRIVDVDMLRDVTLEDAAGVSVERLVFSESGALVTAIVGGHVRVWDAVSGRLLASS